MLKEKKVEEMRSIILSGDIIQKTLQRDVENMALRQKTPGFRPGKVPLDVVFSMHEEKIVSSVLDEMLKERIQELENEKNPIRYFVNFPKQFRIEFGVPQDVEAEVTFVYMPQFEEPNWSRIELPLCDTNIDEESIRNFVERYLTQFKRSEPLETMRPSQMGDTLHIRVSIQDGEGERTSAFRLPLIEGEVPGDIDIQDFVGVELGHVISQRLKVPRFLSQVPLAGKKVQFSLVVEDIQRTVQCHYDEESSQYIAGCDLATLLERAKLFLVRCIEAFSFKLQKEALECVLFSMKDVVVPDALLRERVESLRSEYSERSDFLEAVPETQREIWYQDVAHAVLLKELFTAYYVEQHSEETSYSGTDVLKALETYGRIARVSHKDMVSKYMKDKAFASWIRDCVQADKVIFSIISHCEKSKPVRNLESPWKDVSESIQKYVKLSGGDLEGFDMKQYVEEFSLKGVDLSKDLGEVSVVNQDSTQEQDAERIALNSQDNDAI